MDLDPRDLVLLTVLLYGSATQLPVEDCKLDPGFYGAALIDKLKIRQA